MNWEKYYLGIDVGSVSINLVLMNEHHKVVDKLYVVLKVSLYQY